MNEILLAIGCVGWVLNFIVFLLFVIAGIIDESFWRRPLFWITLAVPYFYVGMAAWYLWERTEV